MVVYSAVDYRDPHSGASPAVLKRDVGSYGGLGELQTSGDLPVLRNVSHVRIGGQGFEYSRRDREQTAVNALERFLQETAHSVDLRHIVFGRSVPELHDHVGDAPGRKVLQVVAYFVVRRH